MTEAVKASFTHVVHSAPGKSGDTLCGLEAHSLTFKTCHTPDQDVLEPYQVGCPACLAAWKRDGGKVVWRQAA